MRGKAAACGGGNGYKFSGKKRHKSTFVCSTCEACLGFPICYYLWHEKEGANVRELIGSSSKNLNIYGHLGGENAKAAKSRKRQVQQRTRRSASAAVAGPGRPRKSISDSSSRSTRRRARAADVAIVAPTGHRGRGRPPKQKQSSKKKKGIDCLPPGMAVLCVFAPRGTWGAYKHTRVCDVDSRLCMKKRVSSLFSKNSFSAVRRATGLIFLQKNLIIHYETISMCLGANEASFHYLIEHSIFAKMS